MTLFSPFRVSTARPAVLRAASAAFLLAGFAPLAFAQAPVVRYVRETPAVERQLIFVNNPERLEIGLTDTTPGSVTRGSTFSDLADATLGRKSLLNMTIEPGSYRNVFEHVYNFSRATTPIAATRPIAYGVMIFNPNATNITVTTRGKGFVTGTATAAQPFVDLFNNPAPQTIIVRPNRYQFLLKSDTDYGAAGVINVGSFFTGVVDFDVSGGRCKVVNIAFQDVATVSAFLDANAKPVADPAIALADAEYSGFVTRRYSQVSAPESRVYKGLMTYPNTLASDGGVVANLLFTITDATPIGALFVTYPLYVRDATTGIASPSTTNVSAAGWYTHNTPLRDTTAIKMVGTDMLDILMPGYGTVYSLASTYAPNTPFAQSNVGNWGVMYRDVVTVSNTSGSARTITLTLNNSSGGGSPIAYKNDAGAWQQTVVRATLFTYRTVTVPANTTRVIEGTFTLVCPGVGTLFHAVNVTN